MNSSQNRINVARSLVTPAIDGPTSSFAKFVGKQDPLYDALVVDPDSYMELEKVCRRYPSRIYPAIDFERFTHGFAISHRMFGKHTPLFTELYTHEGVHLDLDYCANKNLYFDEIEISHYTNYKYEPLLRDLSKYYSPLIVNTFINCKI